MRIFISYSRSDAGDFAIQAQKHLSSFKFDVFTDINNIDVADTWSKVIEDNITNCDYFVIIVTPGSLQSSYVESELHQAQKENKKIIPCFHKGVRQSDIKWGLENIQGIEFNDKFELARDLYEKILYKHGSVDKTTKTNVRRSSELPSLFSWGSFGNADGQFSSPIGIAADSSGNIYVVDNKNHRVQKFTSNGEFMTKWGSKSKSDFKNPIAVAVDKTGWVYVLESYSSFAVQKFSSDGIFVKEWHTIRVFYGNPETSYPTGIAADSSGNIYVVDSGHSQIKKYNSEGKSLKQWGSGGSRVGEFKLPTGIAADSSGNIYVVDSKNHRVQKFTSNGEFITMWGSFGNLGGEFNSPRFVAIDSFDNVYVTDSGNNRIEEFDKNGSFITEWNGNFGYLEGITIGSNNNLYLVDRVSQCIRMLTK